MRFLALLGVVSLHLTKSFVVPASFHHRFEKKCRYTASPSLFLTASIKHNNNNRKQFRSSSSAVRLFSSLKDNNSNIKEIGSSCEEEKVARKKGDKIEQNKIRILKGENTIRTLEEIENKKILSLLEGTAASIINNDAVSTIRTSEQEENDDATIITKRVSNNNNNNNVLLGRGLTLLASILYGTNFATVKMLDEVIPLEYSAAARFGLAAVASILIVSPDTLLRNPKATLGGMTVGFWYSLGYLSQAYGLETIQASKSGFFNALAVIVVPVLDVLFKGVEFRLRQGLSLFLAVAGIALLELGDGVLNYKVDPGEIWCLGQALFFGIGYYTLGEVGREHKDSPGPNTAGQLLAIALVTAAVALFQTTTPSDLVDSSSAILTTITTLDPLVWVGIAWTGLISTALTLYLETIAVQSISAAEISVIMTSTPIWGSIFAYLTVKEIPTTTGIIGAILILSGCALTSIKPDTEIIFDDVSKKKKDV